MPKKTLTPPRYSQEEFVELLHTNLGRLETTQEAQRYGQLLRVLRAQLSIYVATRSKTTFRR